MYGLLIFSVDQHIKIYLCTHFHVNLETYLEVMALYLHFFQFVFILKEISFHICKKGPRLKDILIHKKIQR